MNTNSGLLSAHDKISVGTLLKPGYNGSLREQVRGSANGR